MSVKSVIDRQTVDRAAHLLLEAAPAGSAVILFGSYARGSASPESDLDFLVVEPMVRNQIDEMARLTQVLSELSIAADVLVVSAEKFEYWKDTPNTVFYRAAHEGRIYEQVA